MAEIDDENIVNEDNQYSRVDNTTTEPPFKFSLDQYLSDLTVDPITTVPEVTVTPNDGLSSYMRTYLNNIQSGAKKAMSNVDFSYLGGVFEKGYEGALRVVDQNIQALNISEEDRANIYKDQKKIDQYVQVYNNWRDSGGTGEFVLFNPDLDPETEFSAEKLGTQLSKREKKLTQEEMRKQNETVVRSNKITSANLNIKPKPLPNKIATTFDENTGGYITEYQPIENKTLEQEISTEVIPSYIAQTKFYEKLEENATAKSIISFNRIMEDKRNPALGFFENVVPKEVLESSLKQIQNNYTADGYLAYTKANNLPAELDVNTLNNHFKGTDIYFDMDNGELRVNYGTATERALQESPADSWLMQAYEYFSYAESVGQNSLVFDPSNPEELSQWIQTTLLTAEEEKSINTGDVEKNRNNYYKLQLSHPEKFQSSQIDTKAINNYVVKQKEQVIYIAKRLESDKNELDKLKGTETIIKYDNLAKEFTTLNDKLTGIKKNLEGKKNPSEKDINDYNLQVENLNKIYQSIEQLKKTDEFSYYSDLNKSFVRNSEDLVKLNENAKTIEEQNKVVVAKKYIEKEAQGSFVGNIASGLYTGMMEKAESSVVLALDAAVGTGLIKVDDLFGPSYAVDLDKSDTQKYNEFKRELSNVFDNEIINRYTEAAFGTTEEYAQSDKRNDFEKSARMVSESLGAMAGGGGNKYLTLFGFFSQSYNAINKEMRGEEFDDLTSFEKNILAVPVSIAVGYLDKLGAKISLGDPLVEKLLLKTLAKAVTEIPKDATIEYVESVVKKSIANQIALGTLKIVGSSFAEGFTEGGQEVATMSAKAIFNEYHKKDLFNLPDITTEKGRQEAKDIVLENLYYGTIGGGIMSSGEQSVSALKNGFDNSKADAKFDLLYNTITDPELILTAKNAIKLDLANKKITRETAEQRMESVNSVYSLFKSIPKELSTEQKKEAFNLIREKQTIEKEIEGKDPALVNAQKTRVSEINESLKTISNNAAKETTNKQQAGTAEGGVSEYQGTSEGQPEGGQVEGGQRKATVNETDSRNSTIPSKVQEEVTTYRAEEQAELLKVIPKIENYKVNGEIDKTLMPKTVLDKYNKVYNKYDNLISPLLETTGEITINKPAIATNTTAEVSRVKSLKEVDEDGATFNIDGVKYEGPGLVVPVISMNTTMEEITPEMISNFVEEHSDKIGDSETVKVGIYKFPNSNQVSIDLNILAPESSRGQAIEFGRLSGQESLFDMSTFENVKTGATGENPMQFTPKQFKEIAKALKEGRMPNVFDSKATTAKKIDYKQNLVTPENSREVASKQDTPLKQKIAKSAAMIMKSLPGVKIYLHNNQSEMHQAIADTTGRNVDDISDEVGNAAGAQIKKEIHVNMDTAKETTILHEAFHEAILRSGKSFQTITDFANGLKNIISDKDVKAKLDKFISMYNESDRAEEFLSELGAIMSEAETELTTTKFQKFLNLINRIARSLGLPVIIKSSATAQEAVDFINYMSKSLRTGKAIEGDYRGEGKIKRQDIELNAEIKKSLSEQDSIKIAKEVVDKTIKGKAIPTWVQKKTSNKVKFVSFSGEINQKNVKENAPSSYNSTAAKFSNYNTFNINVKQELNNSLAGASKESINKALEHNKNKLLPKINSLLKEIVKIKSNKKLTKEEKLSKISLRNEAIVNIKKIAKMKDLNDQLNAVLNIEHKSTKDSLYNSMFYDLSTNLKRLKGLELENKSEGIYKKAKDIVKSNLLSVYNSVSPRIRQISKLWYDGANLIAQDMANNYELTNEQAAAIIATQSPQMPWFDNLHLADVIMNLMHSESNSIFTKELFDYYVSKSEGYAEQKKYIPTLLKAIGTPLSKLSDLDAAIFIRAYYDTKLSRKAPIRIPTGTAISEDQKGDSSFSGYSVIAKGISIFRDGSIENISNQLGEANKVRNFYMNIADPSDKRAVTIDTHAMAIALFKPLASNDYEVNFDAATFAFYADAYRELADELGIEARALQSITWEAARAIFPAKEKAKSGYKEKISNIWDELVSGNKSLYKVQEEIFNQSQDPNITEWSEYINILKDEKARTNVSGRIVGLEGTRATNNMGAVSGTSIGESKSSGRTGVSSRGAKIKLQKTTQETRMDKESEDVFKKSLDSGTDWATSTQDALDYIQKSNWYQDATDIEREQKVRDFKESKKQKLKKAPSVAKIMGTPKPKMVTVNEAAAFKDQLRLEAKAAREARGDLNFKRKSLSDAIKSMAKLGKLKVSQATTIITRVSKVNLDSSVQVDRLIDYAAKVFERANYQDRLNDAFSYKRAIRKLLKTNNQAQVVGMANEFTKLDPSMVENIEEYIDIAEKVKKAVAPSRAKTFTIDNDNYFDMVLKQATNIEAVSKFVKDELEKQDQQLKDELLATNNELLESGFISRDMTAKQIQGVIDSMKKDPAYKMDSKEKEGYMMTYLSQRFNSLAEVISDIIKTNQNPVTGERVAIDQKDVAIMSDLLKVDLSEMGVRDALFIVEAMDNFITNGITSKLEGALSAYKGQMGLKEEIKSGKVARPLRLYFTKKAGREFAIEFTPLPLMIERMFNGVKSGISIMKSMGLSIVINGVNKANYLHNKIIDEYYNKFIRKSKTFHTPENVYERGMLAFLKRNVTGSLEEMKAETNRRVKMITQSITTLKNKGDKSQKAMAEIYQKVFDKLDVSTGDIDVIESRASKENKDAVNWWINQWSKHYKDLSDVSLSVYNYDLGSDLNYTPDKYKLIKTEEFDQKLIERNSSFLISMDNYTDKEKTGVLMQSTRPNAMEEGRYLSFDFDANNSNSLKGALVDINTAAGIRQIDGFLNSKLLDKLIPSTEDRDALVIRVNRYIRRSKGKIFMPKDLYKDVDSVINFAARLGVGKALGGVLQSVKQTIPIAISTAIMTGRFNIPSVSFNEWLNKTGMPIANRGLDSLSAIESVDRRLDAKATGFNKPLKWVQKTQQLYLKWFLSKPDVMIARMAFQSYYLQYMKESSIDWANHTPNQDALNYAEAMVGRQQNINDPMLGGEFLTAEDSMKRISKKVLLPFASFGLNQKARLNSDLINMASKTTSVEDKKIAFKSATATLAEMVAYRAIAVGISYGFYKSAEAIIKNYVGDDEDDDDDEERDKKWFLSSVKFPLKSMINDLISPLPLTDEYVTMGADYILSQYTGYTEAELDELVKNENEIRGLKGLDPLEGRQLKKFREEEKKESLYQLAGKYESSAFGMGSIFYDAAKKFYYEYQLAMTGEFKDEYRGNVTTKKIRPVEQEVIKNSLYFSALYLLEILPKEADQMTTKVVNMIKKNAMSEPQYEKYEGFKKEYKREPSYLEMALIRSEKKQDYIETELNFIKDEGGLSLVQSKEYVKIFNLINEVTPDDLSKIKEGQTADQIIKSLKKEYKEQISEVETETEGDGGEVLQPTKKEVVVEEILKPTEKKKEVEEVLQPTKINEEIEEVLQPIKPPSL